LREWRTGYGTRRAGTTSMSQSTTAIRPQRRRWFSYSLRSLFVLVTVLAAGLAWVASERRQSQREAQIADELRALGATVEFAGLFDIPKDAKPTNSPEEQSWWRTALGELLGRRVVSVRDYRGELTDLSPLADLKSLKKLSLERYVDELTSWWERIVPPRLPVRDLTPLGELTNLEELALRKMPIGELTALSRLQNLESLDLCYSTGVRDLSPLAGLKKLKWLQLNSTQVSDLSPLAGLENLQQIDLNCTSVSDLAPLRVLKNLNLLSVYTTKVTKEQVQLLERSLRNCAIYGGKGG
jgi:hypothetical protein